MRALVFVLLLGCKTKEHPPAPAPTPTPMPTPAPEPAVKPLPAPPAALPPPPANGSITPQAVALGEQLFSDRRLSATGTRSCATCHDPAHGFSGGVETAADGKRNARRTPALVDLAWLSELGWDGRAPSVRAMLPGHIAGQLDALEAAAARVGLSPDAVVGALEAYTLTRYSGDVPWDAMERTANKHGNDRVTAGNVLFNGKAQCGVCHTPPLYTDMQYHAVVPDKVGDTGRGLVDPALAGAFRTPSLRNAVLRTSFFHDGSATDLAATFAHSGVTLSPDEQQNLVLFLRQLCGGVASAGCSR